MGSTLEQAEERFRLAQKALEDFVQAHCQIGFAGLDFLNTRDSERLAREYARLKEELDIAGRAWAEALQVVAK